MMRILVSSASGRTANGRGRENLRRAETRPRSAGGNRSAITPLARPRNFPAYARSVGILGFTAITANNVMGNLGCVPYHSLLIHFGLVGSPACPPFGGYPQSCAES